jgi:Putative Actinobacterial Holin-X, holin superfamily III
MRTETSDSATTARSAPSAPDDRPVAELVRELSEQTSALARKEVELAKAELELKGKRLGMGAGAFGAAGIIGLYALGALTACLILALASFLDAWLGALIVTVVYASIAGALAVVGKRKVETSTPPIPERAIESTREDIESAKRSAKEGGR